MFLIAAVVSQNRYLRLMYIIIYIKEVVKIILRFTSMINSLIYVIYIKDLYEKEF